MPLWCSESSPLWDSQGVVPSFTPFPSAASTPLAYYPSKHICCHLLSLEIIYSLHTAPVLWCPFIDKHMKVFILTMVLKLVPSLAASASSGNLFKMQISRHLPRPKLWAQKSGFYKPSRWNLITAWVWEPQYVPIPFCFLFTNPPTEPPPAWLLFLTSP